MSKPCQHLHASYEWHFRPYCPECHQYIAQIPHLSGGGDCIHHNAALVVVVPKSVNGHRLPGEDKLVYYCPDCESYIDYVRFGTATDDDDIPF